MKADGRRTLVVCDDDAATRRVLAAMTQRRFRVLEAGDGPTALALIEREKPEFMLLDLSMPGLDGLEVLARARRLDPTLAVTMLTGVSDLDMARKALALGARSYVTKPLDCTEAELWRLIESAPGPMERGWRVEGQPPP